MAKPRDQKTNRQVREFRQAATKWRLVVTDEPNDLVIRIDYFKEGVARNWVNILRADEHMNYHIDLLRNDNWIKIPLSHNLKRNEKLVQGLEQIFKLSQNMEIQYDGDIFIASMIPPNLISETDSVNPKKGSTHFTLSIKDSINIR